MSEDARKYPSDDADRFQVRMPPGMRDRIAAAATANNRSMNSEIVAALEERYPASDPLREAEILLRAMSPEDRERAVAILRGLVQY